MKFIQLFLLAFGGIALFVGAFVIFNTLSITVAQRTREFATLRALGASRRQVLRSVLLEGLVIGFIASIAGLLLGVGLAKGLTWLLGRLDLDLPQTGTVFETRTVVVSLLVGVGITADRDCRAGTTGNPRAADRSCPRGLDASAISLRPHRAVRGAWADRSWCCWRSRRRSASRRSRRVRCCC